MTDFQQGMVVGAIVIGGLWSLAIAYDAWRLSQAQRACAERWRAWDEVPQPVPRAPEDLQ